MKTEIKTFLESRTFRSDFAKVLGMDFDESERSKLSFNELKRAATEKSFGKSVEVDKALLEDELRILKGCIRRDILNYDSMTKRQKKGSGLPDLIQEDKERVIELSTALKNLH